MFALKRWSVMFSVVVGMTSAGLSVVPITALAESNDTAPGDRVGQRVQHLQQQLGLSDDQTVKVRQILSASQTQEGPGQSATSQDRQVRWQQVQDQINGVLTPEQQAQYAQMQQDHRSQHQGHRHHRDTEGGSWGQQQQF